MDYPIQLVVPDGRRPDEDLTRNVSTVALESHDIDFLPPGTEPSGAILVRSSFDVS